MQASLAFACLALAVGAAAPNATTGVSDGKRPTFAFTVRQCNEDRKFALNLCLSALYLTLSIAPSIAPLSSVHGSHGRLVDGFSRGRVRGRVCVRRRRRVLLRRLANRPCGRRGVPSIHALLVLWRRAERVRLLHRLCQGRRGQVQEGGEDGVH